MGLFVTSVLEEGQTSSMTLILGTPYRNMKRLFVAGGSLRYSPGDENEYVAFKPSMNSWLFNSRSLIVSRGSTVCRR